MSSLAMGESATCSKAVLAGSAKAITEKIQTYVDAGATHIIMNIQPPYDADLLRRFAEEVMPNFRTAGGCSDGNGK